MVAGDGHSEPVEVWGPVRSDIAAADRRAPELEQLGEGAHAGTGDSHEMDRARIAA
jgi:hypothetical protein